MSQSPPVDAAQAVDANRLSFVADEAQTPGRSEPRAIPLTVALPLSALAGLAVWTAFPGQDLWWAAPLGLAVWALMLRGRRARAAAGLGLVFGLAMFIPLLHWSGIYVGRLPWFAFAFTLSLYVTAASAVMPAIWRLRTLTGGSALVIIGGAGIWVTQEALVSRWPFGGFGWSRLAFSQADAPTLGLAALGGAPLLSAAVAATGMALALAAIAVSERRSYGAVGLLAVAASLTLIGLSVPTPTGAESGSIQVAAVQGNVPQAGLDFNTERRAVLDNHVKATIALGEKVSAGSARAPDVVLWPENASDIDPLRNADARREIQRAANAVNAPVVVGTVLLASPTTLSNTLIVWGPSTGRGAPTGPGEQYSKHHPAPFAEYIPFRSFFRHFNSNVDRVTRDFQAGTGTPRLDVGGARLGPAICFEVAFDPLVRNAVLAGADLLYIPTNNATFGLSDESVQQLGISRVRAVESGRAVVHISTVGVSGLIAPNGALIERSNHFAPQVLTAELPLRQSLTVATRVGVWPEAFCVAFGVLSAMAGLILVRRKEVASERG